MRREPKDAGGLVMRRDDCKSERKRWRRQNEWSVGGGSGVL